MGDFSGNFSDELYDKIKNEEFDFVLCNGDFANMKEIGKIFRIHGPELSKIIGEEKNEEMRVEAVEKVRIPLERLNSLRKPVYTVRGNNEWTSKFETFLEILQKYKNISLIDLKKVKINGINIIGFSTFAATERTEDLGNSYEKFINVLGKTDATKTILLAHIPPYNCDFDKIPDNANNFNAGKHVGYKTIEKIIEKYKFPIIVCGHLEEYQGECRKNNSRIINPGAAELNKYAILDINKEDLSKSKVKFYNLNK